MNWPLVLLCIVFIISHASVLAALEHKTTISSSEASPPTLHGSTSNSGTFSNAHEHPLHRSALTVASTNYARDAEAAALLSLKASMTGDPTGVLESWKNGSSPCVWQGILCSADGFVSSINLTGRAISGKLAPDSLPLLPHLKSLDLSDNSLTGPLPPSLCNPSNHALTILNLKNNSFSGSIPRSLGNCTSLRSISLYFNGLSGPIPSEMGLLSELDYLALSFNHLNGSIPIPVLRNCTRLTNLALSLNAFTGPLPSEIGSLKKMQNLWLDSNDFSGKIPPELGNLTQLMLLQLDTNDLTGSIPPSLGQLHSLTTLLSLSINQLSGPIPSELGNLRNLTIMTLKGNFLSGTIPKELGNLQSIQGLYLGHNMLAGTIPGELANLTNLQQLRLDHNGLTGTIPEGLGSLQHLTMLYVNDNMLRGPIPSSLAGLSTLQDLSLGSNTLGGSIPPPLSSLSTIVFNFSLRHNSLNGTIPSGLGHMIHVQNIDLSANNLSGSIPTDIADCVNLMQLNLSFNSLTGNIPGGFQQLKVLQVLDLSSNSLSGQIPSSLADLLALRYLNLSYNNFSGPIPNLGVFTKMNASSFVGNPGLCGPPLVLECPEAMIAGAPPGKGGMKVGIKILIAVASFLYASLLFLLLLVFIRKRKKVALTDDVRLESIPEYKKHLRRFTAKELKDATENFSEARIIGTGAVSRVYSAKDVIIKVSPPLQQVDAAVKVLRTDNNSSFCIELEALGSIRHRNLVKFYGFCDSGKLQALVLELLPNGSLEDQLYRLPALPLSILERLHIALDVANGLAYLHRGLRQPIVHRDVKPSNILFDQSMVAKVADFGIAKLLDEDEVYSKAKGTPGYVAPEYGETTRVDTKGDVFSFGVVTLELLTRRRPTDAMFGTMGVSLPMWVRSAYPERVSEILDPQLSDGLEHLAQEEEAVIEGMLELSLCCTEMKAGDRPDMEAVVTKLTSLDAFLVKALSLHEKDLSLSPSADWGPSISVEDLRY